MLTKRRLRIEAIKLAIDALDRLPRPQGVTVTKLADRYYGYLKTGIVPPDLDAIMPVEHRKVG